MVALIFSMLLFNSVLSTADEIFLLINKARKNVAIESTDAIKEIASEKVWYIRITIRYFLIYE